MLQTNGSTDAARFLHPSWRVKQPDPKAVSGLTGDLNCGRILAQVLVNREITGREKARKFLAPSLCHLRPTDGFKDMDKASERMVRAILNKEKVLVFGDYDADGVTATACLTSFLSRTGLAPETYIPHRTKEGYSFQPRHVTEVALARKVDLVVTVDCGSDSHEAVALAKKHNIDVIITDHHQIPDPPPAFAVINPKQADCPFGYPHLAGVGVAFYFLIHLRSRLRKMGFWKNREQPNLKQLCDLVALGTVADLVPLTDENRILVKTGLDLINSGFRQGIQALIRCCKIENTVDSETLAFRLAPRLNAAGRMDHAHIALDLLLADDPANADETADRLCTLNLDRKTVEDRVLAQAEAYLEKYPALLEKKSIVLVDPNWHTGVLGIVASRLVERHCRPVVLLSSQNGELTGSARSISGLNLFNGLSVCAEHLTGWGGHAGAAGVRMDPKDLEAFKNCFDVAVNDMCRQTDFVPIMEIDAELSFDDFVSALMDDLESLQPYGTANPEPLFLSRDVTVCDNRVVGRFHRRMTLCQKKSRKRLCVPGIWFNKDPHEKMPALLKGIVYRLRWNHWNNQKNIQLKVEDAV